MIEHSMILVSDILGEKAPCSVRLHAFDPSRTEWLRTFLAGLCCVLYKTTAHAGNARLMRSEEIPGQFFIQVIARFEMLLCAGLQATIGDRTMPSTSQMSVV